MTGAKSEQASLLAAKKVSAVANNSHFQVANGFAKPTDSTDVMMLFVQFAKIIQSCENSISFTVRLPSLQGIACPMHSVPRAPHFVCVRTKQACGVAFCRSSNSRILWVHVMSSFPSDWKAWHSLTRSSAA